MNIPQWIDAHQSAFTALSDQIWHFAETGYQETQSARLLADTLEAAGFTLQRGIAGIPTAFIASYGAGRPIIALLGEYDALPGLSQTATCERQPVQPGGNGHGCGHNLLGVGSLAAALAIKEAIHLGEVRGTIRYYGCPAEENGSAKAFLVKAGVFDDVDLALTWHPDSINNPFELNLLANYKLVFKFHGRASHAAADPHNGRSALDAVELMNVGANYLREHIIPEARIHYVITNGGGIAPNVVPPYAESYYLVRAPRPDQLRPIYERVLDIARGAALMTGTQMEVVFRAAASNMVLNDTINAVLRGKMEQAGPPRFSDEERQFARQITATFPEGADSLDDAAKMFGLDALPALAAMKEAILSESIAPPFKPGMVLPGSSDVGDVSWVTPTGQFLAACQAFGTPGHSWQTVAQAGMSIGHKGMLYAARVLALSALEFMQDPELLQKARDEFTRRLKSTPFESPIPDGVRPPLPD